MFNIIDVFKDILIGVLIIFITFLLILIRGFAAGFDVIMLALMKILGRK